MFKLECVDNLYGYRLQFDDDYDSESDAIVAVIADRRSNPDFNGHYEMTGPDYRGIVETWTILPNPTQ